MFQLIVPILCVMGKGLLIRHRWQVLILKNKRLFHSFFFDTQNSSEFCCLPPKFSGASNGIHNIVITLCRPRT